MHNLFHGACVLAIGVCLFFAPTAHVFGDAAQDNARAAAAAEKVAAERAEKAAAAAHEAAVAAKQAAIAADKAAGGTIKLTKRSRVESTKTLGKFDIVQLEEGWNPKETVLILCDVWDSHHCLNAVKRLDEMVERMNQVTEKARSQGVFIIHAPSDCMNFYKDHSGRKLAMETPKAATLPQDIGKWCYKIPAEEKGQYPIDQSDGGEDDEPAEHAQWAAKLKEMGRNPRAPWKQQHAAIKIHEGDAISDSGVEVWSMLEVRGIKNVMIMGVHTNMCVLGRPFGLRRMASNGKNTVLIRDMTDTMYNPKMPPKVSHFKGTQLIIEHIEKYVCPTITSDQLIGGEVFRFKGDDGK